MDYIRTRDSAVKSKSTSCSDNYKALIFLSVIFLSDLLCPSRLMSCVPIGTSSGVNCIMGWDVELIALPADSRLMEVAGQWEDDGAAYSIIPYYFWRCREGLDHPDRCGDSKEHLKLAKLLDEIMAAHPGIETRHCDLERRFEVLEWPLVRCARDENERILAEHAVYGERRVTPTATGCQGFPIKYTSPERAQQVLHWLSSVTHEDLRRNYDPKKMSDADVYKWYPNADPEENFQQIVHDFEALKQFYSEVVAHQESVLVHTD